VHKQKIIAEGFTSKYGESHAEVNAVNAIKDKSILKEATIYVTLEPCSHFGKTPPCANLLAKHQFKNVVIGCIDTNTLVAGKGIEILRKSGINVIVGILEKKCQEHHKRFFTVQNKKRPYIILKWAETTNGFLAPLQKEKQSPVWISNKYSKQLVHKLRANEHAILVGTNTVLADNPKLNVRSWSGKNPVRIVLDAKLRIPQDLNIFDNSVKTIIITASKTKNQELKHNLIFETIDFQKDIASQICAVLQKHKIESVIIEGGTQTLQTFINENLWDEAFVFTGNKTFEKGIKSPILSAKITSEEKIKNDILKIYRND